MSLSLLARNVAMCGSLLAAPALFAVGSGNYLPNGSEYAVAGNLPGTQVYPHLAIGPTGGVLVWTDNDADREGTGIRAVGLNSNFERAHAPFRVNATAAGHQEKPQVALLSDGGAAIVWQGGPVGFQHIFARFLSPSNTWISGDVLVSSAARFQQNPAIASLPDNKVIVVWASYNQYSTNSMQDIYAQVLAANGAKVGPEFRINQFTAFNQRTPAVAALKDGNFAVSWISEGQSAETSIDVYARVFSPSGSPSSLDILVNSTTNVCANPAVVSTGDGGFLVAWSQKDVLRRDDGWDIVSRPISAAQVAGVERTLNNRIYGDQIAPRLALSGSDIVASWTAFGQDGDRDGVVGRILSKDGAPQGDEFLINTKGMGRQMHPAVAADGASRFVVTWSSYTVGTTDFDVAGQLYAPADYLPLVASTNYVIPVFVENNTGGDQNPVTPDLGFPPSNFTETPVILDNGFQLARGTYEGLFYNAETVTPASSGSFSISTTAQGKFTGRILLRNQTFSIGGTFDSRGKFTRTVAGPGGKPMTVALELHLGGGNQVRGSISGSGWQAEAFGVRNVYSTLKPCPQAGVYTMLIPPQEGSPGSPGGFGYGVIKVSAAGVVLWNGTLADGTKVAQRGSVSSDGVWPLFASPYSGRGVNLGWVRLSQEQVSGDMVWIRPGGVPSAYYPSGFTNQVGVLGSAYVKPPSNTRLLDWTTGMGHFALSGGGLQAPIYKNVLIDSRNRVLDLNGRPMAISINTTNGTFSGKLPTGTGTATVDVKGAFLQGQGYGAGYFNNGNKIGQVQLAPAAAQ